MSKWAGLSATVCLLGAAVHLLIRPGCEHRPHGWLPTGTEDRHGEEQSPVPAHVGLSIQGRPGAGEAAVKEMVGAPGPGCRGG